MNKITLSHGQSAVPMNLFATWEVDRSSPHSIPRVCSISLRKLIVVREFDKDAQSFFLAARMQGSKRILRSNEIALPCNENSSVDLELTFSLQYSHFVKREGNLLQIMLQRKKRYKNRAMLGYKTLAVGTLDLAQIIQSPITDESSLDLISANKDQRNGSSSVQAQVVVSNAHSTPADEVEVSLEQPEKRHEPDRLQDIDYTDDEETFSSEQEIYLDEENPEKQKERRKHRLSSSSRQQNFIKAKLIGLLRKFKQVEDEGLEEEIGQGPHENDADAEDLDFLYNQIEDLNLSDSCPEVEDNISILSTPKPKLRPFFDRVSHSSSQTEISSLRDHLNGDHIEPVKEDQDSRMLSHTPTMERSDSSEPEDYMLHTSNTQDHSFYADEDSSLNQSASTSRSLQMHHESGVHDSLRKSSTVETIASQKKMDFHPSRAGSQDNIATDAKSPYSLPFLHGGFASGEDDAVLSNPIILINSSERRGHYLEEAFQMFFQSGNDMNAVILTTTSREQIRTIFVYLTTRLQKLLSSNSMPTGGVKIVLAGTDSYFNLILQQFIEFLRSRSPEWISYFLFLLVPLGKTRLGQYLSSLDSHYGKLFSDQTWYDAFERASFSVSFSPQVLSSTPPSNPDRNHATDAILIRRIQEYIDQAVSTLSLSIAEAMLTFGENSENEGSQKFVPFISEAKVFLVQVDSDREECATTVATSNASHSPSISITNTGSNSTSTANSLLGTQDTKMGLQVDYWKEKDLAKYSLKTTFKSFIVSKLPLSGEHVANPNLSLDVVTIGKKNIMRLPGKKGKEKETESKSSVIPSINRVICTSKHQHNLLKVKIDGIEWSEVKFFQLSSFWSSHIKTFPVGVFPS